VKYRASYALLLFLVLHTTYAQVLLHDKESGKEILVVTDRFSIPPGWKALGKIGVSGSTGIDDQRQLARLARKAVKKNANLVRVSNFIFSPGGDREALIEGELYNVFNFDSLKASFISGRAPVAAGFAEVIFYRPMFGKKKIDDHPLTLRIDASDLTLGANKAYKMLLKSDSTYFIKIPDFGMFKLTPKPGTTNYVRCSYRKNTEGALATSLFGAAGALLYLQTGGSSEYYLPHIVPDGSAGMKELEYLMSGFIGR
jgi:hypothetical protein